jgi:hypothetical protein
VIELPCAGNREVGLHPGRPQGVFSGLYKPPFLFPLALPFLFNTQQAPSPFSASFQQSCLPTCHCSQRNAKDITRHSARTSRHSRILLPSSAHTPHLTSTSCPKPLEALEQFKTPAGSDPEHLRRWRDKITDMVDAGRNNPSSPEHHFNMIFLVCISGQCSRPLENAHTEAHGGGGTDRDPSSSDAGN